MMTVLKRAVMLLVDRLIDRFVGYRPKTAAQWHAFNFYGRRYVILRDLAESLWVQYGPPLPKDSVPSPWGHFEPEPIYVKLTEEAWLENFGDQANLQVYLGTQVQQVLWLWYELALIDAGYVLKQPDFPRDIIELIHKN